MLKIRSASKQDLPAIRSLVEELMNHERPIRPTRRHLVDISASYYEELLSRAEEDEGDVLVASIGEVVVGFLAYAFDPDDLERDPEQIDVTEIVVAQGIRRTGVASALMDELENLARRMGTERIVLTVLEGNDDAKTSILPEVSPKLTASWSRKSITNTKLKRTWQPVTSVAYATVSAERPRRLTWH